MLNRILIALGIRKKVLPDTQECHPTADFPQSDITDAYASGKLPKKSVHVGTGHLHYSGKPVTNVPPSKAFMSREEARRKLGQPQPSDDIAAQSCYLNNYVRYGTPYLDQQAESGIDRGCSTVDTSPCSQDSSSSPCCGSD